MEVLDSTVHLVIKAPNQKIEDQTVACELNWTIHRLKTHLSKVYPNHPKTEDQKLIYSGRLLHDDLKLEHVLYGENGNVHIVHLVCMPPKDTVDHLRHESEKQPGNSVPPTSSQSHSSLNVPSSGQSTSFFPSLQNTGNSFMGFQPAFYQQSVPAPMHPFIASPENMLQQIAAMQQFYAQYMAQYMHHMQTGAVPDVSPSLDPEVQTSAEPVANVQLNQEDHVQPRPANQNIRMNAQGGRILDDDEEEDIVNGDWLDWIYAFSRMLVLFSIVYFYSSFGRFLIILGSGVLIYLYRGGWLGAQQGPQNNGPQPNREQQANRRNPADRPGPAPTENSDTEEWTDTQQIDQVMEEQREMEALMDGDRDSHRLHPDQEESRPASLLSAWTIISSFVSSLIPEHPAPPNVN